MPYSSGTYTLPSNSFAVPVTGTTISSSAATSTFADFATAFTTCVLKDGTQTITANIPMAGFIFTGLGAGDANGESVRYQQLTAAASSAIRGFTYANNGSDPTNDIDIAAGGAMDSTNAFWIQGSALTKRSDAAWAVGTNAGGLDTGAVGNSDYYIWAILRSDTGVVDYLFSLSSTAPTMPTSYDYRRLIGWFKRVGGTIVAFTTYETEGGGLELIWSTPTLDVNLANTLTTARRTDAVKVPLNFSVEAHLNVGITDAAITSVIAWIYCPDQTDQAPTIVTAPGSNVMQSVIGGGAVAQLKVRTSSTGTIAARANIATVDTYAVNTMGFRWPRR